MPSAEPTRICVASHHLSLAALQNDPEFMALSREQNAFIELRLDKVSDRSVAALQACLQSLDPARCVLTCRRVEEGGSQAVPLAERLLLWEAAAAVGAAWIDVEQATLQAYPEAQRLLQQAQVAGTRLCVSFHDFDAVPSLLRLTELRRTAEELGADLVKIATQPRLITDALPMLHLLRQRAPWKRPLLGLAMGEQGLWSRVLPRLFPWAPPFTFARGETAAGTAPGQPTWRVLRQMYRCERVQPDWPIYGVIGAPIGHSLSPRVHNDALQAAKLPGVYLPFLLEGEPSLFLREMAPLLQIRGLSVTLPHKEAVLPSCRQLDPLAERIGAVNTLTQPDGAGTYVGSNTDAAAAANSLRRVLGELQGRTILILGAGGVAKAVAHGVRAAGAAVLLCNRSRARASELAAAVHAHVIDLADLPNYAQQIDAVVNATPVGMAPNGAASPLEAASIPQNRVVFDTIYNPPKTELLKRAEQRGCKVLGGMDMFIEQAAAQFQLFTGTVPSVERLTELMGECLHSP